MKIVLLGATQVGKTSIVLRFVRGKYYDYSESTVGASFLQKSVLLNNKLKVKVSSAHLQYSKMKNSLTFGFRSLAPMYYRNSPAAIIVYDITNMDTFEKAKTWVQELRLNGEQNTVICLVGNKCDLEKSRTVRKSEAFAYADTEKLIFFETSALTGENVTQTFEELGRRLVSSGSGLTGIDGDEEEDGEELVLDGFEERLSENERPCKKC